MREDKIYNKRITAWMSEDMRRALYKAKKEKRVSYAKLIRDAIEKTYGKYFDT